MKQKLAIITALITLTGCAHYHHSRNDGLVKEETSVNSFLMLGKASNIKTTTKDGSYSRTVGVGSVDGRGDVDMLKALIEAGVELGKKSQGIP